MYNTLKESYLQSGLGNSQDEDYPERALRIELLTRVLKGQTYSHLNYSFHDEYSGGGQNASYIPLRKRKPSVRYNICKIVVDDSVSLLFGEDHFPRIHTKNEETKAVLEDIIKSTKLILTMTEAATLGSVGSVVILFSVHNGHPCFEVKSTQYLTPIFDIRNPYQLAKLREERKIQGRVLQSMGYVIKDPDLVYWFVREWDEMSETLYVPYTQSQREDKEFKPVVDEQNSRTHNLGFVPAVWIKNLPCGDDIDGQCTFEEAIDTNIELDYQLSQAGRGLKYSADPKLVIKTNGMLSPLTDPAKNAVVVETDGDAKLLEINGNAARAVLEYAEGLRKFALESIHGNRSDSDKISAAQSGRAMELMNQPLIWLVERLRITYGECALLALIKMIIKANQLFPLIIDDRIIVKGSLDNNSKLSLIWPAWYAPTSSDKVELANGLKSFRDAGNLSRESAVKSIASVFDIENVEEEITKIKTDEKEFIALTQPKTTETKQI